MIERCLTCSFWESDWPNPEAEERAVEARLGDEVAIVGECRHPDHPMATSSKFHCPDWAGLKQH